MQSLIATTFEVVHYIALQAVHYKPLQEVHLSRYNHSDMEILKKADFDDFDNPTSFSFVSKKTHDSLTIFLNKYSKELYMKYRDIPTRDGLML